MYYVLYIINQRVGLKLYWYLVGTNVYCCSMAIGTNIRLDYSCMDAIPLTHSRLQPISFTKEGTHVDPLAFLARSVLSGLLRIGPVAS